MMEVMGTAASVRAVLAALRAHASRLPSCSSTCRMDCAWHIYHMMPGVLPKVLGQKPADAGEECDSC